MLHEFIAIFIFVYIAFVPFVYSGMEGFLRECKDNLKNYDQFEKMQIVLGSEACDLDSAVSSLTSAYFLHKTKKAQKIILPVLNVKRSDLRLHSEVAFFLEETSIPLDTVICKDEVNLKQLQDNGKLDLALVDHNVLSAEDSVLEPCVISVIDHHVAEHPDRSNRCVTKIEPVGSCCTLVAEEIFKIDPSILDPQIAMLLYGTIILDTVCLEESAKRVTPKDVEIAEKLEKLLEGISREEVFKTLQKAKFDVSELTDEQLLQKDLKMVSNNSTTIAISSIPTLLESRLNQAAMESALVKFCCEKQLKAVILMGAETNEDKKIKRQIAVYSPNPQTLEKLTGFLKSLTNPSLELEAFNVKITSICAFEQGNSALSRKFVLPAVRNYILKDTDLQGLLQQFPLKVESTNCPQEQNTLDNLVSDDDTSKLFHMDSTELSSDYQTETLDFPDSPKHSNLLKISLQLQDQLEKDTTQSSVNMTLSSEKQSTKKERTESVGTGSRRKKISVTPEILRSDATDDDQKSLSSLSNKSDADVFSPVDDLVIPDDIDTPEEMENSEYSSSISEPIPEMSAAEEFEEERSWKTCFINGTEKKIDMKVIEPYKKVLSHGGYYGSTRNAIIIFCACYLPDRSRKDYDYVMDNLFLYVLTTLDQLVAEDYILVYLHGATQRTNMPSFGWLKRCYQMIDRRLRKNLKGLYLVHPTFWLKTIVIMTRPFISTKFSRKLRFVDNLEELSNLIPMDHVCIPDKVKEFDEERFLDS